LGVDPAVDPLLIRSWIRRWEAQKNRRLGEEFAMSISQAGSFARLTERNWVSEFFELRLTDSRKPTPSKLPW
jgi:hypothetical protein